MSQAVLRQQAVMVNKMNRHFLNNLS